MSLGRGSPGTWYPYLVEAFVRARGIFFIMRNLLKACHHLKLGLNSSTNPMTVYPRKPSTPYDHHTIQHLPSKVKLEHMKKKGDGQQGKVMLGSKNLSLHFSTRSVKMRTEKPPRQEL